MASIQFGASGEIISTKSANALQLGQRSTDPFNFNAGLGIATPELLNATGGDERAATRAAGVSVNTGGKFSVQFGDGGGTQAHGVTRVNSSDFSNGESGLMATVRRDGTPRPASNSKPTDRITIDGMETTVEVAERLGMITRDPRTGIRENVSPEALKEATGEAAAERAAEAAVKAQAASAEAMRAATLSGEGVEEAAQTLASNVGENTQTRAILELAESGEVSENAINRAASEAGINPDEMRDTVNKAMGGFVAQASDHLAAKGVDPTLFYQWAKTEQSSEFKVAMLDHVRGRDVSAWNGLASRFMQNLDRINPQAILSAKFPNGGSAYMDPGTGNAVIRFPDGRTYSWAGALQAGLLGDLKWGR